jgi:methyltransferase
MTIAPLILGAVTLQRVGELALARRNTRRLLERGAVEVGSAHYPLIVALHAAWLIALWVFGYNQPVSPIALTLYLGLQALRAWVMLTLGARWTTRIILLPGQPLIAAGPYRFLAHPNYAVVAGEILLLPLVLELPLLAIIFSFLNAAVLAVRIATENRALSSLHAPSVNGAT